MVKCVAARWSVICSAVGVGVKSVLIISVEGIFNTADWRKEGFERGARKKFSWWCGVRLVTGEKEGEERRQEEVPGKRKALCECVEVFLLEF